MATIISDLLNHKLFRTESRKPSALAQRYRFENSAYEVLTLQMAARTERPTTCGDRLGERLLRPWFAWPKSAHALLF